MSRRQQILGALGLVAFSFYHAATTTAENWPGWRGPRNDGTSLETNVPVTWSPTENIVWRVAVPGIGHASPIVWDDKVFVVTCLPDTQQRVLLCFDRVTGKTLWEETVLVAPLERMHSLNSRASSTPATDGKRVYVSFLKPDGSETNDPIIANRLRSPGDVSVSAYDFDGQRVWSQTPGRFASVHGFCSPPILFEELVIINGDHDGDGYLVALDRDTGETVWKTPRENNTRSYAPPIIRPMDGRLQMVLSGSMCVASYDPRDGSQHWTIDGPTEQFVASAVYDGSLVFITGGFPDFHILAIRPDGTGNVTDTHIAWRTNQGCAYVPSPIVVGEYFLVVADNGIASCFDAVTGHRHWKERVGRHYSGSLVAANGNVYFTSDDGDTKVIRADSSFDVIAHNKLNEACAASPAISGGQLFLRTESHLYCIEDTSSRDDATKR